MNRPIPIVLAAFGTTSRAMETYGVIDAAVKAAFPAHPVQWAYTSRMVRSHLGKHQQVEMKNPGQVLDELGKQGYPWAVVQSLHMICGHEFCRLVDEVREGPVRVSMGLPLLTAPADYQEVASILLINQALGNGTATVLVGHGTDHPAWTAYPALGQMVAASGANVHMATVEGGAAMARTVAAVIQSGARQVHLVPLMLVAGVHVEEDIAGDADSWKRAFSDAGMRVTIEKNGLGQRPAIVDIFVRHIRAALAIIPEHSSLSLIKR